MENKSFLDCRLTEVKVNDSDDDFFTFEGYAATFGNVDLGGDKIKKGAFADAIKNLEQSAVVISGTVYKKLMPILWQHNWDKPLGSFIEMREDAKGLYVKGIMPKADTFVSGTVIPQLKVASVSDMSIGYMVVESTYDKDIRILEKLALHETSLVTIPMNPKANITGFKSFADCALLPIAPRDTKYNDVDAFHRVTAHYDADEKSDNYGGSFIYSKSDGEKESYKMQIADVIDGTVKAIPSAIFSVAASLALKSDIEGCENAHKQAVNHINKYYKKMKMETPFKESSAFRIDDMKSLTNREVEQLFKTGVAFSDNVAKSIISALNSIEQRDAATKNQRDADISKLLSTINQIKIK